ncbi:putative zinc-binding protein [Undibacterium oligocarboniphilum]|uniref:Putative zinc-binding protein n=1 Tax=Undibacterium oligocarboniphilum TaxID=666702 RepID=A0A850QHG5_9BURK|nr:putative zinc-binding protein [Undibacterium oligocarboniphilum]MBC3868915.1 putative zinc-binding protein [Undibacterium oligocarboniphilum]NVO76895.1 putative zinc-binding protein [Undibacterium oligocarboniphilum]
MDDAPEPSQLPLVYACSGCSSVAQLANDVAVRLDREGQAQMSCISGVGGGVKPLVRLAQSGRPILALDGCALACVKACLQQAGVEPDRHLILNQEGARKRFHADASTEEMQLAWQAVQHQLAGMQIEQPLAKNDPESVTLD